MRSSVPQPTIWLAALCLLAVYWEQFFCLSSGETMGYTFNRNVSVFVFTVWFLPYVTGRTVSESCVTRMHSSRMRTVHCSGGLGGGGVCQGGVCLRRCLPRGGCLPRTHRQTPPPWTHSPPHLTPRGRHPPGPTGRHHPPGPTGRHPLYPEATAPRRPRGRHPPVNRITDKCKTLALHNNCCER